jgi:phosphatidylserine decarboxylase
MVYLDKGFRIMKATDAVITPIHKEGHAFIAGFFITAVLLFFIWQPLGWIGIILTAWCMYFFRNPDRVVPTQKAILVSPADGTVSAIKYMPPPPELGMGNEPRLRITIFLSVFNVHVNRTPAAGKITAVAYVPGEFLSAADEDAGERNERQLLRMTTEDDMDIAFSQIAGLVARKIICDAEVGQTYARGELFGLIRFGSRTDIYLDKGMSPLVSVGQTMVGGETVIAIND